MVCGVCGQRSCVASNAQLSNSDALIWKLNRCLSARRNNTSHRRDALECDVDRVLDCISFFSRRRSDLNLIRIDSGECADAAIG